MPLNHLIYIMKTASGFSENCHFGMPKLTAKSFLSHSEVPEYFINDTSTEEFLKYADFFEGKKLF